MTEAQLLKRVEFWQRELPELGVGHWRVKQCLLVPNTPDGGRDASASVWFSSQYDSCEFFFQEDFAADAAEAELDETIIHEWLHVAWRDLDLAVQSLEKYLSEAAWDDFDSRFNHEREGLVERLARTIYSRP